MQGGLLESVEVPHPEGLVLNTPSWSAHTTERVRKPPPQVLVHCSECVIQCRTSENFETYSRPLANTVWKHLWCLPFHLQCKCSTCTCKHVHNVVECNTNTEYIEHWDVIITHHWYGVCSISSDYCSAMSNREYLHVHNCDSVMIASVWVANYSYSKAEDQGRPHVATGIGGRRTASTLLATGHWPSLQFCINIVRLGSAAYILRTWTGNDTVQQLQGWGCFDV